MDVLGELWFYRYAHFPVWREEAYGKLLELLKGGVRSSGWDLKENIEVARKEGHSDVERLTRLAKVFTEDAPVSLLEG